jgi:hypothetical protein
MPSRGFSASAAFCQLVAIFDAGIRFSAAQFQFDRDCRQNHPLPSGGRLGPGGNRGKQQEASPQD